MLPSHRLELFGQLSSGHYGCVFKGVLREGKDKYHTVAIKRLKRKHQHNEYEVEELERPVYILRVRGELTGVQWRILSEHIKIK